MLWKGRDGWMDGWMDDIWGICALAVSQRSFNLENTMNKNKDLGTAQWEAMPFCTILVSMIPGEVFAFLRSFFFKWIVIMNGNT
jgi:hypothetical protein